MVKDPGILVRHLPDLPGMLSASVPIVRRYQLTTICLWALLNIPSERKRVEHTSQPVELRSFEKGLAMKGTKLMIHDCN